jgi:dipeptidyl aminopeptidase/acylaminoacyl peptidase
MGGAPRELREQAYAWSVSPDGSLIAFSGKLARVGSADIWIMQADGEQSRKLLEADEYSGFDSVVWSPDGQRLAYAKYKHTPDKELGYIETRDLHGTDPVTVISGPAGPVFPPMLWLSDGRLLFGRVEENVAFSCNFWSLPISSRTGRADGAPERFTNWTGICPTGLSATRDGHLLAVQKISWHSTTLIADLGPNAVPLKPPVRLTVSESIDTPTDWTADGKEVLFTSDRNGHNQVFRQSLQSDNPELVAFAFPNPQLCCVSPDGAWILIFTTPDLSSPSFELRRVPINGGPSQSVLTARNGFDNVARCSRAPATLCLVAEASQDHKRITFTAFDPLNGRGKDLLHYDSDPGVTYSWTLSPDGTRVAVLNPAEDRVHILHLDGRSNEEIVVKNFTFGDALDWSADGKGLFVDNPTSKGTALSYLDLHGNTHVVWEAPGTIGARGLQTPWGIPSRDGRHLAINGSAPSSNMWLLENF